MKMNPYLNFDGQTEEAFDFYKSVFGGEFSALQRFKEVPPQEGQAMPEGGASALCMRLFRLKAATP